MEERRNETLPWNEPSQRLGAQRNTHTSKADRYVGIEEKEEDDEPFDQKMTRLTTELGQMFEQSHKLEEEIKKNLEGIGFKI